jgi:plasmid stabilization system protein ParE
MDRQVFLSQDALKDLEAIVAFVATHDPQAAVRVGQRLTTTALALAQFAERGRIVPEFQRPELREVITQSYRVIYRIHPVDGAVEIVRFWHAARGFPHIPTG